MIRYKRIYYEVNSLSDFFVAGFHNLTSRPRGRMKVSMSAQFISAPDGRKVPVPAGMSLEIAEKIAAKSRRAHEFWDEKKRLTEAPPALRRK